jgi:hypothetical protein
VNEEEEWPSCEDEKEEERVLRAAKTLLIVVTRCSAR